TKLASLPKLPPLFKLRRSRLAPYLRHCFKRPVSAELGRNLRFLKLLVAALPRALLLRARPREPPEKPKSVGTEPLIPSAGCKRAHPSGPHSIARPCERARDLSLRLAGQPPALRPKIRCSKVTVGAQNHCGSHK